MKAESKRRVESNEIINDYIANYLDQLQQSLNSQVNAQFDTLKTKIESIDGVLTKIEREMDA